MEFSGSMLYMLHLSSAIRRWSCLFIILMIGVVIVASVMAGENFQLLLAETSDSEWEKEEVEVDDLLNLITPSVPGPLTLSPGLYGHVIHEPVEIQSICFADHLHRGPPFC